jgi:hypothetical protein
MDHAQSNHVQDHAVTAKYRNTELAKRDREVDPDTPSTALLQRPQLPPLQPPILNQTSKLPYSIYSPSTQKDA